MPNVLSLIGDRWDLEFRRGGYHSFSLSSFRDGSGATITNISSARITYSNGTIASPTTAVTGVTVTPSVSGGASVTWTLTSTQTRLFTAGSDYCYVLEVEYADGLIEPVLYGSITVHPEIVT